MFAASVTLLALAAAAAAQGAVFVINVGHNLTANATTVFQPERVNASVGDVVIFNFTLGTHTAIQSSFAEPCIPISQTNSTINGFNSGPRPAGNGTTITTLNYTVLSNFTPVWFYDQFTCGAGGVGVINSNESVGSTVTLAGFVRNAIRLNGTAASNASLSSASEAPHTATGPPSPSNTSPSGSPSSAIRGVSVALPLALVAFSLSLF